MTPGGRGGAVIRVTSLDATGPGTLDEALNQPGPRIIVFEVGGVIDLNRRTLTIRHPYVTIAAQTAPDPGVTLIRGGVRVKTHDVVIRHLMVRPGNAGQAPRSGWETDGIVAEGPDAHNIIVDHCSLTWATDENLSASGPRFGADAGSSSGDVSAWRAGTAHRITFSNNIIAEGLSNATHSKGEHSKGSLIHDNVRDVLIVGNLYANNRERNPLLKGGTSAAVVNNLICNPGRRFLHYNLHAGEWGDHAFQAGEMSVVGNVFRAGPGTPATSAAIALGGDGPLDLFAVDNLLEGPSAPRVFDRFGAGTAPLRELDVPAVWPDGLNRLPASAVAQAVLASVGARPWARDPIDARLVAEARDGGGKVIDSQDEVGGYPSYTPTRRQFDPDAWTPDAFEPIR
ncbi:MAG: pectate lyase [Alphaproteobacteria bacterium]|nr:MAG: pectate lyase [Caulobacteraceae bacterium]TPW06008.1 MAG: pectate lyase [Alphaproteobacteria bacterium]